MSDESDKIGRLLGDRYRVEREIGRGGMAAVHLATDLRHSRRVAIKTMRPEVAAAVGRERFLREIRIAASLQHPHIVPLFDSGAEGDLCFFVMPYLEGGTLRDLLRAELQLPTGRVAELITEVADALDEAHRHGLVHRDLKPENVMLSGGHALVSDFGIAREAGEQSAGSMTGTGVVVGTPGYMSPEQIAGSSRLDARSDVYALGCLAYEMLGGQPPFIGPTPQALLRQHLHTTPPLVHDLRPGLRPGVARVIQQALAKSPADRHRTAGDFARALAHELSEEPAAAAATLPLGLPDRGIGRAFGPGRGLWLAVAGLAGLGLIAGLLWWPRPRAREHVVENSVLAVFPFTVRGEPGLEYLGDGMVSLMAATMDGAGTRVVDARALLNDLSANHVNLRDPAAAAAVARRFGASRLVLGDVLAAGGRLYVQTSLYSSIEPGSVLATGSARGTIEEVTGIVDSLSLQLLTGSGSGLPEQAARLRRIPARNVQALKAYLRGEEASRLGDAGGAIAAYQEAIAQDSSFALAWYRLSMSELSVGDVPAARGSAARAERLSGQLPQRERTFLEGALAYVSGQADRAEALDRAALDLYPDDAEVWQRLGFNLFIYNPLRGRPTAEAREPLTRAARLSRPMSTPPSSWDGVEPAAVLLRIAVWNHDRDAVDSLTSHALTLQPGAPLPAEWLVRWLVLGSSEDSVRFHRSGSGRRSLVGLAAHCGRFDLASRFAEESVGNTPPNGLFEHAAAWTSRAALMLASGRAVEARAELARSESPLATLPYRALFAVLPYRPAEPAELAALHQQLITWRDPGSSDAAEFFARFRRVEGDSATIREYLLGLLEARQGRWAEAESRAAALERVTGGRYEKLWGTYFAHSVRAEVALSRHDDAKALAELESAPFVTQPGGRWTFRSMSRERFLRAELLWRAGRTAEALRWYSTLGEVLFNDYPYFGPALRARAAILGQLGREGEARVLREQFLQLWQNCDPELRRMRTAEPRPVV